MIVLPQTMLGHPHIQVRNRTVVLAILSNLTNPVLVGDPSIQHGFVVTNCKKGCDGILPQAHFLDRK
jgi:hypothetical protein